MQATKQFLILLLFGLISTVSYSQNIADTTKAKSDSTKQKEAKRDSTINALSFKMDELAKILEKNKDTDKENTGVFFYDTLKKVPVYSYTDEKYSYSDEMKKKKKKEKVEYFKKTARTIIVDKILMLIKDGYIIDVQVFSGNKVFTNYYAPITVSGNRFQFGIDYLYCTDSYDEAIMLQETLRYIPLNSFFPEDKLYELNNQHYRDTVYRNVGVNTVVDFRLYTDALATLGNEANGLFQTDIRVKQFLHRIHYRNKGLKALHYLKLNFNASKLDSKNSFVDSSDNLSRAGLYQKSKIKAEVAINLFSSWLGRKTLNGYYFDFGAGYNTVDLARSKDTIPINVPSIFWEGGVTLRNSSNAGFDFYTRFAIQFSPQTDFKDQDKGATFFRIGGEIFWNPSGDAANRIFGRINYTMGLSTVEKKNAFSQVQIGYSVLLSKAIGKK